MSLRKVIPRLTARFATAICDVVQEARLKSKASRLVRN